MEIALQRIILRLYRPFLLLALWLTLISCANGDDVRSFASPDTHSTETAINPEFMARGERLFNIHCMACHTMSADGANQSGPHLADIYGRTIATDDSWSFPPHLAEFDFVWSHERMHAWLETPQQMVPDMCLPFRGLRQSDDIEALMHYLEHAS